MVILSPCSNELTPIAIAIEEVIEQSIVIYIYIMCCFVLNIYFIFDSSIGLPISMQITSFGFIIEKLTFFHLFNWFSNPRQTVSCADSSMRGMLQNRIIDYLF